MSHDQIHKSNAQAWPILLHVTHLEYTTANDGITAMITTFEVMCHGKQSFFVCSDDRVI